MYMAWSHYLYNLLSFYSFLPSATIAFFVAGSSGTHQTHILFRDLVLEYSSNWDVLLQYPQVALSFSSGLYSKVTFSVRHHSDLNCCCILPISDSLLYFYQVTGYILYSIIWFIFWLLSLECKLLEETGFLSFIFPLPGKGIKT